MTKSKTTYLAVMAVLLSPMAAIQTAMATPITSDADPALDGSTLINFEGITPGEYASLVLGGVTINGIGSTMTICTNCGGGSGLFGDSGQSLNNTGGTPYSFEFIFDDVVSAFGIVAGAANSDWNWEAFDAVGNSIESVTLGQQSPGFAGEFLGIAASGIKRVEFTPVFADWLVLDDLRFTMSTTVPEPGTLALLGIGLFGMGLARRRRKV